MGVLESMTELGYITNAGMAWRVKLHMTSLVVLEYIISDPIEEPIILNSQELPLVAMTVGKGCTNLDKDSFISHDLKDPLKLFTSDKSPFPKKKRFDTFEEKNGTVEANDNLDSIVEVEMDSSAEVVYTTMDHGSDDDDEEEEEQQHHCTGIDQWLNKHLPVEGYHVICINKPPHEESMRHPHVPGVSYDLMAWKDGYYNIHNSDTHTAATFSEFRSQLERLFGIERTDSWRVKSLEAIQRSGLKTDGSTKWAYLPQRWRLFDEYRQPVESLNALHDQQILLLFEGGQFIYPGVDLNFKRQVQYLGNRYDIVTLSMRPLLLQVDDLLEDHESAYMIDYSRPRMVASDVSLMDKDKGKAATEFRTSQYVFMVTKKHANLQRIDKRIANITGLDILNQEDAQILKYEVGNYYFSHNDYWSPAFYQSADMISMTQAGHKNRMATVFWYMNSDVGGGCTSFTRAPVHNAYASQSIPVSKTEDLNVTSSSITSSKPEIQEMIDCDYGLKVSPKKGRAIIFYSLLPSGNGDDYSEHAACAVTSGTKWAANKWIWNQERW